MLGHTAAPPPTGQVNSVMAVDGSVAQRYIPLPSGDCHEDYKQGFGMGHGVMGHGVMAKPTHRSRWVGGGGGGGNDPSSSAE